MKQNSVYTHNRYIRVCTCARHVLAKVTPSTVKWGRGSTLKWTIIKSCDLIPSTSTCKLVNPFRETVLCLKTIDILSL